MWHVSDREEVDAGFRWENMWEVENLENLGYLGKMILK
jgi:hypothetical protein